MYVTDSGAKNLRYAAKYQCPRVYCFDGETLLFQFQATREVDIEDENLSGGLLGDPAREQLHYVPQGAI